MHHPHDAVAKSTYRPRGCETRRMMANWACVRSCASSTTTLLKMSPLYLRWHESAYHILALRVCFALSKYACVLTPPPTVSSICSWSGLVSRRSQEAFSVAHTPQKSSSMPRVHPAKLHPARDATQISTAYNTRAAHFNNGTCLRPSPTYCSRLRCPDVWRQARYDPLIKLIMALQICAARMYDDGSVVLSLARRDTKGKGMHQGAVWKRLDCSGAAACH